MVLLYTFHFLAEMLFSLCVKECCDCLLETLVTAALYLSDQAASRLIVLGVLTDCFFQQAEILLVFVLSNFRLYLGCFDLNKTPGLV